MIKEVLKHGEETADFFRWVREFGPEKKEVLFRVMAYDVLGKARSVLGGRDMPRGINQGFNNWLVKRQVARDEILLAINQRIGQLAN